jgi:hypothetical protein
VLLDTEKHSPSIGRDDSSTSTAWRPFCSCGWSGIAILSPVEIRDLQEVFQKFAEENGIDSILPADSVFGDENDALIQVLDHIGYDPEEDESISMAELDAAVHALKNYDEKLNGAQGLYDLTSDFPRIVEAVADQKHRSFVYRNVATPTLRENAAEAELFLRQHLIKLWESKRTTDSGSDDS